jgi:hypothetical protein
VQLRFILRRGLDDFRSASSTASAVGTGEGGFGATPQQSTIVLMSGRRLRKTAVSVSRLLRIVMENGWYHVMNRGIDCRLLFPDNKANEHFR